jgi:hypothetical protein
MFTDSKREMYKLDFRQLERTSFVKGTRAVDVSAKGTPSPFGCRFHIETNI